MVIVTSAPVALPVHSANLPTESVRNDARLQERVPETKPTTENVRLKPSTEDVMQTSAKNVEESKANESHQKIQEQNQQQSSDQESGRNSQDNPREDAQKRQEQLEVQQLKSRDREVKAHEAAHASVGGQYAGAPSFTYSRGPDGQRYAVAGEVSIDVTRVADDPEATIQKMDQVRRAALAPADPSAQDRRIASRAAAIAADAQAEALKRRTEAAAESRLQNTKENESSDDKTQVAQTSRERFEIRLKSLGIIDSYERGSYLSVSA